MRQSRPLTCSLLAGSLLLAAALPAMAAPNVCEFRAYSDASDPAGTNVRSGPGTSYGIVGVLMPEKDDSCYVWSPEFAVPKFDNGWFQIGDAMAGQYGEGPEVQVFKGPGWVSAMLVEFAIENANLRDGPSWDAKVILGMAPDTLGILTAFGSKPSMPAMAGFSMSHWSTTLATRGAAGSTISAATRPLRAPWVANASMTRWSSRRPMRAI